MRRELINHVTDSAMDRSKRAIPSAFAMGKIMTGITADRMELDSMVNPGMYRFNTDATCETQPSFPFAGKAGFLSVFTVTPEEDTSAFQTTRNVRQVAWLDDTQTAKAYTRTGYYNSANDVYVWSNAWTTLGGTEFGAIFNANGNQVTDLNLYTEPGVWVVGEPSPSPWLHYPSIVADYKHEIDQQKFIQGILFVMTEEKTGEYTENTTPCYTQVLYLYNAEYVEPFLRSKPVNGDWGPWTRNGKAAYLAEPITNGIYIGDMITPGLFAVSSGMLQPGDTRYNADIASLPENFREDVIVEVKRIDVDLSKSRTEIIRQTIYTGSVNAGHVWTRAGSIERKLTSELDITWTPWVRTDGACTYLALNNHIVRSDLWNGSVEYTEGTASLNTIYISNGDWILELPNPEPLQLGDQVGLIQMKGEGAVVYPTAANVNNQQTVDDYDYKEETAPVYKRNASGGVIVETINGVSSKVVENACFYQFTVTEDEDHNKYWQLEIDNGGNDTTSDIHTAIENLRRDVSRIVYLDSALTSTDFSEDKVDTLDWQCVLSLLQKWPEFTVVAIHGTPTVSLPSQSSAIPLSWSTDENIRNIMLNDVVQNGRLDFDGDGVTSVMDLYTFLYCYTTFADTTVNYNPDNMSASGLLTVLNGNIAYSRMAVLNNYPVNETLMNAVIELLRYLKSVFTAEELRRLNPSGFTDYMVSLVWNKVYAQDAKRQVLKINVIVNPSQTITINENTSTRTLTINSDEEYNGARAYTQFSYIYTGSLYKWVYLTSN